MKCSIGTAVEAGAGSEPGLVLIILHPHEEEVSAPQCVSNVVKVALRVFRSTI
jgi:hypothetical protein